MKLLVIGSGGREHAIVWKMSQNPKVTKIYACPGNAGTQSISICENIELINIDDIIEFAKKENIELTILGSEELLVAGIVDKFKENGLVAFGPHKAAAILEGSKAFAKEFMLKYGIKTAAYKKFDNYKAAKKYLEEIEYPTVIKASGLAAGKGVIICETKENAETAVKEIMLDKKFGDSGNEIVIEEFLTGVEASILSIYDGKTILPFISAKDHKKIGENETGLNTGGMGVIAPNPYVTNEVLDKFNKDILEPTLKGLKEENLKFCGFIFFGLMINEKGVYLLEYNMRMGDPETQAILPLMKSDFVDIIIAAQNQKLNEIEVEWEEKNSCCVVAVSGGYPEAYEKGYEIKNIENIDNLLFLAGAKNNDNKIVTNGGRVLNIVAIGDALDIARKKAYNDIEKVDFKKKYFRRDIGIVK
ncbi:phosphoribosylamine--glycine ligase [Hypnocyclicus thermotrophus]|uniref:Phosphoribosylamine--glycine ligase n=1 Tax=Hypnocyclicus thermotrophus TaxID=1627895 RepID=A0AA46DZZ3_9FUSO|nr:phosphoribosylamine--glycine ligase [Hypnocyclicus thermotrophus]TDT71988.1 phosphoribosylamine--glycine ligase [Hypnocyclicus thermotrophus]